MPHRLDYQRPEEDPPLPRQPAGGGAGWTPARVLFWVTWFGLLAALGLAYRYLLLRRAADG